jgi:restriction system protein
MTRLWKVGLGRSDEFETSALEHNILTIDFSIKEDVSHAKDRDAFVKVMEGIFPNEKPTMLLNIASQMNQFVNVMTIGDLVVCSVKSSSTISIGRIAGPYTPAEGSGLPSRSIEWLKKDLPRNTFNHDLLFGSGTFMTVYEITRNEALAHVQSVLGTDEDLEYRPTPVMTKNPTNTAKVIARDKVDALTQLSHLEQIAREQIEKRLAYHFTGHNLTKLVASILQAQGLKVYVSPPGADGGIDILAGSGPFGLESPRFIVQVKSGTYVVQHTDLETIIGTVEGFKVDYALLVSWNGFSASASQRQNELSLRARFWGREQILDNLFSVYDRLPEEIRADLPLRRIWMLVPDEDEDA